MRLSSRCNAITALDVARGIEAEVFALVPQTPQPLRDKLLRHRDVRPMTRGSAPVRPL